MDSEKKRRWVLAWGPAWLLSGCVTNPNAVTAENAPHDLAQSGKAYVVFDIHSRLGGIFGDRRAHEGGVFINAAATPNLLYARTPDSMKLNAMPPRPSNIFAIDPGTYYLSSIAISGHPCFFGPGDSPVSFTVGPGEVIYLGSLQYEWFTAHNPNPFANPRYHVTFEVNDELDSVQPGVTQNLALLPGNPVIRKRLMTIRKPEVMVGSTKANWLDSPPPKDDWAPPPPSTPTSPGPAAPPPDTSSPWHEAPPP
jgi:hypothetical protein